MGARGAETPESAIHPTSKKTFVKFGHSQKWLQKILGHSSLKGSRLLSILEERLKIPTCDHGDGPDSDPDDPMAALSYDDDIGTRQDEDDDDIGTKAHEKRVTIKTNAVVRVGMPELCPTASAHGDGRQRMVTVWWRGGNKGFWIAKDDVEWAVSYMKVELETCGVAPLARPETLALFT